MRNFQFDSHMTPYNQKLEAELKRGEHPPEKEGFSFAVNIGTKPLPKNDGIPMGYSPALAGRIKK